MIDQVGVSFSEIGASTCLKRWEYAHHPERRLAAKSVGPALARGIAGHEVLEEFYKSLQRGDSFKDSVREANAVLKDIICESADDPIKVDALAGLKSVLGFYFEYYEEDVRDWEIISVEGRYNIDLLDTRVYLPSRLDLVIKQKRGKFRGETSPVDHKFVYDFWTKKNLVLNAQMPLYIATTRSAYPNAVIKRAIVNQIRYRFDKDPSERFAEDIFQRNYIVPTANAIKETLADHTVSAVALAKRKVIPLATSRNPRSISKSNCDYCNFSKLCEAEFIGEPTKLILAAHYKPNDYGYDQRTD